MQVQPSKNNLKASLIIPVWNGASVIEKCLEALFLQSGLNLFEVICIDNASSDDSADRVLRLYSQNTTTAETRLIRLPTNLGFAGGVNTGIDTARGDIFILLNQDCIIQSGWLEKMIAALEAHPQFGILGCTILNAEENQNALTSVNHTGAYLQKKSAAGIHLTDLDEQLPNSAVRQVEFATGAALAIRRETWIRVGRLDEGYYPTYYEDADYCYRARKAGIESGVVMQAKAKHLFSNRAWKIDPLRHTANHHSSRYRFICKHFNTQEIAAFFESEIEALDSNSYLDQAVGRCLAARQTLRSLADIAERRRSELGEPPSHQLQAQLRIGFTHLLQSAFRSAENMLAAAEQAFTGAPEHPERPDDQTEDIRFNPVSTPGSSTALKPAPNPPTGALFDLTEWQHNWQETSHKLVLIHQHENSLLTRIYFRSPEQPSPEAPLKKFMRRILHRLPSRVSGRDYRLWAELIQTQRAHLDLVEKKLALAHRALENQAILQTQISALHTQLGDLQKQISQLHNQLASANLNFQDHRHSQDATLSPRIKLLEMLTEYDYRN